jgi:hypothetical protein
MQAVYIKDKQVYEVTGLYGTYQIDGVPRKLVTTDILALKSLDNIRKITETRIITHYLNGETKVNVTEYEKQKNVFLQNTTEDETNLYFESLEHEYSYKKFLRDHTPIYGILETISEPLTVPIKFEIVVDTGNPFIRNRYINGSSSDDRYLYNRTSATLHIVNNKFTKLGFVFQKDVSYLGTKNLKIWGNSNHNHLKYLTAFGKHLLGEKWDIKQAYSDNLQSCLDKYEEDKKELENIIQNNYDVHFGTLTTDTMLIQDFYSKLQMLYANLFKVQSVKATSDQHRVCQKSLKEILDLFPKLMKND